MALSIGELVGYVDLDTEAAEKASDKLTGLFGGAKSKWSKLLAAGGIAAGGAFATSLVGAINLEPGRDRVAAALDLTEGQAAIAGRVAGKVYADGWGESADDVNAAIEAVMSSISGMRDAAEDDLAAITEAALVFASTMEVDVGRAAQVAGQLVTNDLAANATEAFDLLTAASSQVPVELREDVLDAADEYGQFFAQLGMDGPAAMALLAQGAEQGMYGIDKAGDAVKEFTIRATDMSATSKEAYATIGLDAQAMANAILAGGETAAEATDKIIDGLLGITDPATQANTAIALFGTPLEDLGTKNIPAFLRSLDEGAKALGDWEGATARAGNTVADNAQANLTRFGRQIKTTLVENLGGRAVPMVNKLTGVMADGLGPAIDLVGDGLGAVTGFLSEHTTTAKVLVGVLTALVVVTAAHSAAMAVSAAGGMAQWLKQTRLISAATKVWTAVQWAWNAAMAANPLVLITLALVALGTALVVAYKKSETFRAIVDAAFSAVAGAVSTAVNAIAGAVSWVIGFVRDHWKMIVGILLGPLGIAVALITGHWDTVKAVTSSAIDAVIGFIKGIPGKVKSGLSGLASALTTPFREGGQAALDVVRDRAGRIVDWVAGIPDKLKALGGRFGNAGKAILQQFIDGMKNAAGIISGIAGNVWNAVKSLLNGAIDRINRALEFTINLPGPDLHVNPPDIPHLATGGRATGATLAVIGEGQEPETVLPDSVLRGLLERAHAAGAASAGATAGPGRAAPLIGSVVQQPGESAAQLAERLWFLTRSRG